jgi:4-hydroxybenzoyl-CoA thioesterase
MNHFVLRRQVPIEWGQCDPAGIVFNSRFFEFFDWSTWLMFEAALGVPKVELMTAFGIAGFPLVGAGATFVRPVRFGDTIDLEAQVSEFRRSSFDVRHRLSVGGTLAAEGWEKRVWAGRDPNDPSRLKSKPVPPDVIARLTSG